MSDSPCAHGHGLEFDFEQTAGAQQVIALHSKSFAFASRLLPAAVRDDVCKLYAWCRWCDNAVDEAPSHSLAKQRLRVLRDDIELIYMGKPPQLAASGWFADLVANYDIPKQLPLDLLLGMESDLDFQLIRDQADLELYCYRVAGVVGLMMCRLLGVTDPEAYESANRLGIGMQMTNIARDVSEDWDRGRCYLPATWIRLNPSSDTKPDDSQIQPHVRKLLSLAEYHYRSGAAGYPALPAATRVAIRVAAAVYREIGIQIERANFCVMSHRHFVPTGRKILLFGQQIVREVKDRFRPSFGSRTSRQSIRSTMEFNMHSQFNYLVVFGLSMTLIMATVLFALMGLNPKLETYNAMPWIYSVVSASTAAILWFWAQSIAKKIDAAESQTLSE